MKNSTFLLFAILILAAVLRLIHPFQIPFSYDEMSAITRTHYSNLRDEITKGVMLSDTHPVGVQIFLYYWTKLFGYSEIVVKLPFILCGIFSVYYVFRIGKEWFNSTTGFFCAAYFATIQYTIMYSQLARPYSSGLFLSLVMVWHWNKVVFGQSSVVSGQWSVIYNSQFTIHNYYKHLFLYILFSALCAYNHHFSLLFAAIVGFTGIFFVRGKSLLKYVFAGAGIFILYIPHLHIFFYQLKERGVEAWLGKPHNTFIIEYLKYILQFSAIAYILAGLLFLFGLVRAMKNKVSKYQIISLSWFIIPFLTGFLYSRYVNAVLQYSVLIFSFPFMLYSIFGWVPNLNIKARVIIVLAICAVNVFVLVNERKYYTNFYKSHFEQQVLLNDSIYKKAGANNVIALSQSTPDSIIAFYSRKYHTYIPYTWMPDSSSKQPLIQYLEQHKTPYLTYDYIAGSDLLYLPVILNYYPYVALANNFQEGTNFIFSRGMGNGKNPYVFQSVNNFDKPCEYWGEADKSFVSSQWSVDSCQLANSYYKMDSLHEWAPAFTCDLAKMTTDRHNLILISLSLYPLETLKDVDIVSSLKSGDKEIFWSSTPVSEFIADSTRRRWVKSYHSIKLPDINLNYPDDIKVSIYIWNRGRKNFYMDDFAVRTIQGNPIIYWTIEKI